MAAALDKTGVVAVGNKADLLALGLVGGRESQRSRAGANFGLGHLTERKNSSRQLVLSEGEEKIRLILGIVDGAQQVILGVGALLYSGVVPGSHVAGIQRAGTAPQAIELDLAIAHHARIRRATAEIFGNEAVDHTRRAGCPHINQ